MIALSEEIIEKVAEDLRKNGIETEDLINNLLDHICCILEEELHDLSEFEHKYPSILSRFYKQKLSELEEETQQLLTFKNYYAMKKTMLSCGALVSFSFIVGAFLKYMHWPGAAPFLLSAIVLFSFVFLPLMIILKMRESSAKRSKLVLILGMITGILASISVLFKLMWWPGANILSVLSLLMLMLIFLPVYFFTGFRNPELKLNTIVTSILLLAGGGMIFSLISLTNSNSTRLAIDAIESSLSLSLDRLHEQNNQLEKSMTMESSGKTKSDPGMSKAIESTNALIEDVQQFRTRLIATVEEIPAEKAKHIAITDLPDQNNYRQVKELLNSDSPASKKMLIEKVNAYNQSVQNIKTVSPIVLQDSSFINTQLHFVVHVLNQLAFQAEANKQALLNYEFAKADL